MRRYRTELHQKPSQRGDSQLGTPHAHTIPPGPDVPGMVGTTSAGCRCVGDASAPARRPRVGVYSHPTPPPWHFRHRSRMQPALAAWLALSLLAGTGAEDMCGDPPAAPSRSIPAPKLSPEEQFSPHMPESLRCDACHTIAFQVGTGEAAPRNQG